METIIAIDIFYLQFANISIFVIITRLQSKVILQAR